VTVLFECIAVETTDDDRTPLSPSTTHDGTTVIRRETPTQLFFN